MIQDPPIYWAESFYYLLVAEVPRKYRNEFIGWLYGRKRPMSKAAYVRDWREFQAMKEREMEGESAKA